MLNVLVVFFVVNKNWVVENVEVLVNFVEVMEMVYDWVNVNLDEVCWIDVENILFLLDYLMSCFYVGL